MDLDKYLSAYDYLNPLNEKTSFPTDHVKFTFVMDSTSAYFAHLAENLASAAESLEKYSDAQNKHDKQAEIAEIAETLPGVQTIVTCPCDLPPTASIDLFNPGRTCRYKGRDGRIYSIIQHLNDGAGWSREKIADWLDELHDSGQVNLEFEPWQEEGESNE